MPFAWFVAGVILLSPRGASAQPVPPVTKVTLDVMSIPADLAPPPITDEEPAPGKRVVQQLSAFHRTEVIHSLYLPTDWKPDTRHPVIVEYLGLRKSVRQASGYGFGISGGTRYIWVVLPYVAPGGKAEAPIDGKTHERLALVRGRTYSAYNDAVRTLGLSPQSLQEGKADFVHRHHPAGRFTIVDYPWVNHASEWVLRDVPLRAELRRWVDQVLSGSNPDSPRAAPIRLEVPK